MKSKAAGLALMVGLYAANAAGQGDSLGADEIAAAIVQMTTPVWTGPRTPVPSETPRPVEASMTIPSETRLVTLHAPPQTPEATLTKALQALEEAHDALSAMGWPAPLPDGSLGGGPELDLYLADADRPTAAYADGLATWSFLDRASTFAIVSPATPDQALEACVTAAYAEALLLSMDPAEARTWRRATAAWLTWVVTGRFGCEDAVFEQQAEPARSWISGAAEDGAGGAMLLGYLSARHDGPKREFVRDAWLLSSQRTWEGDGLRAEPDLWAAIETSIARSGDRLLMNVRDLAVQRWFVGRGTRQAPFVRAIDGDARVPAERTLHRMPTRAVVTTPLEAFGSSYVLVADDAWGPGRRLRVWLNGEYGVRWSLAAVQLDPDGNEIRRVAAPSTEGNPTAYVPVELTDDTRALLLVVTNLSSRLPDADEPDANRRAFEVVVDRAND
ncbi:MAG: hypothetical protein AAF436_07105 [Myxococcota bacterium]